jgi:hypothetical protein
MSKISGGIDSARPLRVKTADDGATEPYPQFQLCGLGLTVPPPLLTITDEVIERGRQDVCPANHSVPTRVLPYPGFPGFEAVATSLTSPRGACTDRGHHRVASSRRKGRARIAQARHRKRAAKNGWSQSG